MRDDIDVVPPVHLPRILERGVIMIESFLELRRTLTRREIVVLGVLGTFGMLVTWHFLCIMTGVSNRLIPKPLDVLAAFRELHFEDALVRNMLYSLKLNMVGMLEAIVVAIPLGFLLGLISGLRGLVEKQIAVFRYLPLTLLVGLFI